MLRRALLLLAMLGHASLVRAQSPGREPSCHSGDAGRTRTGELWQRLRAALASVENARTPLAIGRYERALSQSGELLSESRAGSATLGNRLFRTATPFELSRAGFVVTDSVGQSMFRAPDASVLLSDEFAADHCFDVVTGRGPADGMRGLRFTPVPGRRVADVRGVMWVDIESLHPRYAEFTYWFPTPSQTRDAGGRIIFERLASSDWIAREWSLRTPVLTQRGQVLGYREEGGEAMTVTPHMRFVMDSVANSRKVPGIVTGIVTDSLTGQGFAGARVWLDSAGPQTRTDAKGLYFLRGVPPGEHLVRFSHPMLDSIGVQPPGAIVTVASESIVDANLGGPSLATLVGRACDDSLALMTGAVRDASSGAPVDSATVTLTWIELRLDRNLRPVLIAPRETMASTDATGRYGACVLPGVEITAFAQRGAARTARVDVMTEERRLGILNFALDLTAPDSLRGTAEFRGVVKYQDGTPLRSAIVTLSDPEISARTDTAGRFRIGSIPGGTRALDARAVGHAPHRVIANASPGAATEVTIYLRRVTMLDPVLVRAAADDRTAETLAALAERQRRRQGTRITQSQLRAFRDLRLDAVFHSLPYARLQTSPDLRLTVADRRGRECWPSVWLDGRRSDLSIVVQLATRDVMSVEVMRARGEVPVEYQDSADCGAVLVWMSPLR